MNEVEMIDENLMEKIAEEMREEEAVQDEAYEEPQEQIEEPLQEAQEEPQENTAPVEEPELLRMLEAILFASSEPISPQAMLERLPEGADLNVLLPQLKENYQGRGVELVEVGGQWAFRTAQDVGESLTIQKEVARWP
ncbi:MAG: SMC-Scp complex subunit ScpB [Pseudomonadota bacterium]